MNRDIQIKLSPPPQPFKEDPFGALKENKTANLQTLSCQKTSKRTAEVFYIKHRGSQAKQRQYWKKYLDIVRNFGDKLV